MAPPPRFAQIAETIREGIRVGLYPVGGSLPSESELAIEHGVSPGTVRQALKVLVQEGVLNSRRGARKTVMRLPSASINFAQFRSFAQWVYSKGQQPGGLVIKQEWAVADNTDRRLLRLRMGESVLTVLRLRTVNTQPVMVERTRYAREVGEMVSSFPADTPSVTNELLTRGVRFVSADHTFAALGADEEDSELLRVPVGTPLLRHRRVSRGGEGTPLEWSEDRYRGKTVSLAVSNTEANNSLEWIDSEEFPGGH